MRDVHFILPTYLICIVIELLKIRESLVFRKEVMKAERSNFPSIGVHQPSRERHSLGVAFSVLLLL